MNTLPDTRIVTHRFRALAVTGVLATLAAMAATTLAAALARAAGVATVTGFFSLVGVVLAAALLRWSAHPARRFMAATVALTAISLVPPVLAGADLATGVTLVALHLVAAAVMIPVLTRRLRTA